MSAYIRILGDSSYNIDVAKGTVNLKVDELANYGSTSSGAVRLELWLTAAPWNPKVSNSGYKVAVAPLGANGANLTLAPYAEMKGIDLTAALQQVPPPGNYFVTLLATEYTGKDPGTDNGYVLEDLTAFPTLLTVGADHSISISNITMPTLSVESQQVLEGNAGTHDMTFTVVLSHPVSYTVMVDASTLDETTVAGHDYTPQQKTLTFAPGATTASFTVPIIGNTAYEPARAFEVDLSMPVGATILYNADLPNGTASSAQVPGAWGVIMDDDAAPDAVKPTDALFPYQWYLFSANVPYAWTHATGKGIKIAVFDQGIDASHADLGGNSIAGLGRVSLSMQPGGAPVEAGDNHGTAVAGIISAAKDGKGIVGVAYDAQLVSLYTPDTFSNQYLTEITNAFHYAAGMDVLNDSWGFGNLLSKDTNWAFLDNAMDPQYAPAFKALQDLAATGRNGLGTVVVQSAGNGFDFGDDTNLHNFQNSRYIITVGATDSWNMSSEFSTTGASILVSAPGGGGYGDYESILTTDRAGQAGNAPGDYAFADGTSFSAPIVSGIVALMLEVNPRLGYRDVQQILAYTAQQTGPAGTWASNGAHDWNGGGLQYDDILQSTGFGVVDALAATRLAASWDSTPRTSANVVDVIASADPKLAIPDNNKTGISSTIKLDSNVVIERVDVTVNLTHTFIGDLEMTLVAPSGTASYLMYRPSQGVLGAFGSSQQNVHFTFDTVLDWGESAAGTWTLKVRDLSTGNTGTLDNWSIDVIGHQASADHTFIYTAQYADLVKDDPARGTLSDPNGGIDTINASALGTDDRIDLSAATASSINGAQLTIAQGTTIRNAVGGDGNNVLIANAKGSLLRGMGGNDTLTGGSGNDTLDGGRGNDKLDGGAGVDVAVYHGAHAGYTVEKTAAGFTLIDKSGVEGSDELAQVERIQFDDITLAFDVDGNGGQAFRIYQAAFDRVPDAAGLGYWMGQMDGGMSLLDVAEGFVQSNEFKGLYGADPGNAEIVNRFYSNVLHRAPDKAGADFWTKLLDDHSLSAADVLVQFSESAENKAALVGVTQNGIEYQPFV